MQLREIFTLIFSLKCFRLFASEADGQCVLKAEMEPMLGSWVKPSDLSKSKASL